MNLEDKIDFWKRLDQECYEIRKSLNGVQTKANIVLREIVGEDLLHRGR